MNNSIGIKNLIFGTSLALTLNLTGCSLQKENQNPKTYNYTIEEITDVSDILEKIDLILAQSNYTTTPSPTTLHENTIVEETTTEIEDNRTLVALTFDDGPSKYTDELASLLNEYDIPATFFVLGCNCDNYPTSLVNLYENGHEIAIHGETHTSFTKLTIDEANKEITYTIDYIESLGIDASEIVRPPYGSLNDEVRENIKYPFILWNIDSEDWKTKDKDLIKEEILNNIQEGAIILMHDTSKVHSANAEALKELLPELTKQYKFVTISELFNSYNIELEAGKVYRKIKSEN